MKRLAAVLVWSVIAAAFIGPGTVTTAASAGARFGYSLLWALAFSSIACLVLQEASARLTVVSGHNLGQALRRRYARGWQAGATLLLILGAIVLGCAAYQAGNILGGVAGATLALRLPAPLLALLSVTVAALLLWFNSPRRVAVALSLLVALMGLAFLTTAWLVSPSPAALARGLLPAAPLPAGAGLLALGLVGTTVVPYNLFLGSGLAAGQRLGELRFGLSVAVLLGGLISMAVLVVGAATEGTFSFAALAALLGERLGAWASPLFAGGLFAAGLSSAVTAPLAAAITARSLFSDDETADWSDRSWRFRGVWLGVLAVGLVFGVSGVQPIPVILLAQALNGVLLPFVALFLLLAVNDRRLMGAAVNGLLSNAVLVVVAAATFVLGLSSVARAGARVLGVAPPQALTLLAAAAAVLAIAGVPVLRALRARRDSV